MANTSSPKQADSDSTPPAERRSVWCFAFLVAMLYAIGVMVWFHDRSWCVADEGVYSHNAERSLAGEVLCRDFAHGHPGYDCLANSVAFVLFGKDLLSLRYPLVAMTLLSCAIVFVIVARRSVLLGFIASICVASLSVVQFLNPAAYWYCFFLFAVIVACLTRIPKTARWRTEIVGFLVVVTAVFHQLVGVHVAIGVLTYMLLELPQGATGRKVWVSRSLHLIMAIGLAGYSWTHMRPFAFIAYGIWPLSIVLMGLFKSRVHNRDSLRLVGRLTVGTVIAVLPVLIYHLTNGSVVDWLNNTFILTVATVDGAETYSQFQHFDWVVIGFNHVISPPTASAVPNGLFWMLLPILPAVLGAYVVHDLSRRKQADGAFAPLPFLACFFALVSLRLQIPVYLFFTVSFTMAGLCWMSAPRRFAKYATAVVMLFLCTTGMVYHAGQSLGRFADGEFIGRNFMIGERFPLVPLNLPRATLWVEQESRDVYQGLVKLIDRESAPGEAIFALPYNPEMYFLAQRPNFSRYCNTAFGIRDQKMLDETIAVMRQTPPRLVIYRDDDKYNTEYSHQIMQHVRKHYRLLESQNGFDVYRWAPDDSAVATR